MPADAITFAQSKKSVLRHVGKMQIDAIAPDSIKFGNLDDYFAIEVTYGEYKLQGAVSWLQLKECNGDPLPDVYEALTKALSNKMAEKA